MTSPTTVLIVEDELLIAEHLRTSLMALGYSVVGVAANFEDAVRLAEPQLDLALLDIHIQGTRDGIETARYLRQHTNASILFLTAYADRETLARAKSVEPAAYLVKPFTDRSLVASLECALERRSVDAKRARNLAELSTVIECHADGILVVDEQGSVRIANIAARGLLGRERSEDCVGRHLTELVPLPEAEQVRCRQWFCARSNEELELATRITGFALQLTCSVTAVGSLVVLATLRASTGQRSALLQIPWVGRRTAEGSPLITVCAACHRAQEDPATFVPLDQYLPGRFALAFSHTFCPSCLADWTSRESL